MSLNREETQLVRGNLTNGVLNCESTTDKGMRKRMHKRLEACYDHALWNARKSSQKALAFHMLHNNLMSQAHEVEATKWRSVADEVLRVIELVHDDSYREG